MNCALLVWIACHCAGKASILVTGVGGLGLWAVSMARALLPLTTKIYAADVVVSVSLLAAADFIVKPISALHSALLVNCVYLIQLS